MNMRLGALHPNELQFQLLQQIYPRHRLYRLLQKEVTWNWVLKQHYVLQLLKIKLTLAPILTVCDRNLKLKSDCDESGEGSVTRYIMVKKNLLHLGIWR